MKKITIEELQVAIEAMKLQFIEDIKALNDRIVVLEATPTATSRDRGPKSDREMTEEDARKVMLGEFKDLTHKAAAEKLGLSYGQIYSARGGYTFKKVYKEMEDLKKSPARRQEDTKIN
jgi:hypothetical protein